MLNLPSFLISFKMASNNSKILGECIRLKHIYIPTYLPTHLSTYLPTYRTIQIIHLIIHFNEASISIMVIPRRLSLYMTTVSYVVLRKSPTKCFMNTNHFGSTKSRYILLSTYLGIHAGTIISETVNMLLIFFLFLRFHVR